MPLPTLRCQTNAAEGVDDQNAPRDEDAEPLSDPSTADNSAPQPPVVDPAHANHCFVVMPYGQDAAERKRFRGWYEVVIEPAIRDTGLTPILAAAVDEPNAINDEIRSHLALDPLVVVDLGGATPTDSPNPNVMYELGIRHALDLPLVLMAWEGQSLPFDISNQRAVVGDRDIIDIAPTQERLARFIAAAQDGRFYRPMEAVRRIAAVDFAADQLSEQSVLSVFAEELRELRRAVSGSRPATTTGKKKQTKKKKRKKPANVLGALVGDSRKKELKVRFLALGGTSGGWATLMSLPPSAAAGDPRAWSDDAWDSVFRRFVAQNEQVGRLIERGVSPS